VQSCLLFMLSIRWSDFNAATFLSVPLGNTSGKRHFLGLLMSGGIHMHRYFLQRILLVIPVILVAIFVVQLIMHYTPGDVTVTILGNAWTPEAGAQLREKLGLNRPFWQQYLSYVLGLLRGEFGTSYITGMPVAEQVKISFPYTALLVVTSMVFAQVCAIPVGIRAAAKPMSLFSAASIGFSLLGISAPIFWVGMLFILLFSLRLKWLPSAGLESWKHYILPSITLGLTYMAGTMRTMRSSLIDALQGDYIKTARAKGVKRNRVIYVHALRNALLPTITVIGSYIGGMFGGAVITENVFGIPGMGRLIVNGVMTRDIPSALAGVTVMAACVGVMSLVTDLVYAVVDPRIKAIYMRSKVTS
jgi:peptide/nickel transport system permease protein